MELEQQLDFFERLLELKPTFDRLCEIGRSKLLQAAESGRELTRFKVTKGKRSRTWNADLESLIALFGDKVLEPPKDRALLSVAEAEKVIGKKEVKPHFRWNDGATLLKPITDIARAISVNCSEFN